MRFVSILFFILFLYTLVSAGTMYHLDHDRPQDTIIGETLRLEINHFEAQLPLYEANVFYRLEGESDFMMKPLQQQGFLLYADIPTNNLRAGQLQYYFAFHNGRTISYLPQNAPQLQPFHVRLIPAQQAQQSGASADVMEVLLLSPEPDEMVPAEDFVIALSVPVDLSEMSSYRFSLLLGGIDQSSRLEQEGTLISFAPRTIRSGLHNAEFKVYDKSGQLVGQKSFSFRISGQPSLSKGYNYRTHIFLDNRYQNISENAANLFRGGVDFFSSYQKLDFRARLLISSEEAFDRQPVNQIGAELRYNFTPTMNAFLKGGDFTTNYDPLVFWEKRIRGLGLGMNSKYFDLDVTIGETLKGVEGQSVQVQRLIADPSDPTQTVSVSLDSTTRFGTYKRSFLGIQPKVNVGKYFSWGLNLVNAKDDIGSIKTGGNPKEALVVGSTMHLNLHGNRIQFRGSFQASMKNEDARGTVEFDTLAEKYELSGSERDLAESLFNLLESTGFLSLTQGLSPYPSLAMEFQTELKYFNQALRITYRNIEAEYTTPGNPYLMRDIRGIFINDNIRLLKDQVFLNIYFNSFQDNVSREDARTDNRQFGATISYFPFQNLPGVSLDYSNLSRENELAKNNISPDSAIFFIEDNQTQRLGLSSSYNFVTAGIKNTLSISASNFKRSDDAYTGEFAYRSSQSDFNVYTLGLRNQFTFPLISKINYTKTSSLFGKSDFQRESDINKISVGLEYILSRIFLEGELRPYITYTNQSITSKSPVLSYNLNQPPTVTDLSDTQYNRVNYTGGFYFRTPQYGNFAFRFDYIDFGDFKNWSDTIFSTRYEISL